MYYKIGDKVEVRKALTGNGEEFPYWKPGHITAITDYNYIVAYEEGGTRAIGHEQVKGQFPDDNPIQTLLNFVRPSQV